MSERLRGQFNRRSRMETCCEIMKVVAAGAQKPTHIMYRANLSWSVMRHYIRHLEDKGIIESTVVEGRRVYQLTNKGFALLNKYLSISDELRYIEGTATSITVSQSF